MINKDTVLLNDRDNALSAEQSHALQKFVAKHGRQWKSKLSNFWSTGTDVQQEDGALLRQIRNSFGPTWLYSKRNHFKYVIA